MSGAGLEPAPFFISGRLDGPVRRRIGGEKHESAGGNAWQNTGWN